MGAWSPERLSASSYIAALHRLQLFQRLLWVLGFLAGFLCLLLGLGAWHTWRWVQSWVGGLGYFILLTPFSPLSPKPLKGNSQPSNFPSHPLQIWGSPPKSPLQFILQ